MFLTMKKTTTRTAIPKLTLGGKRTSRVRLRANAPKTRTANQVPTIGRHAIRSGLQQKASTSRPCNTACKALSDPHPGQFNPVKK
jgi:hypothetical protein